MEYGFNIEVAQKLGVNEAIVIKHFQHWMLKNQANDKNFYDGRYWTYNSQAAFCAIFPFWSDNQIRHILKKLVEKRILLVANYNKNPYDKTRWYSIDEQVLDEILYGKISEENIEPEVEEIKKEKSEDFVSEEVATEDENFVAENQENEKNGLKPSEIPSGKFHKSMWEKSQIDVGNFTNRCGKIPTSITHRIPNKKTHTHDVRVRKISPSDSEVDMFFADYKTFKNSEFEPSHSDRVAVAKILAENGGYNSEKREYWQTVFKNASRGWKIVEKDVTRIVPCSLDKILANHSRIKAGELGLLPPKKVPAPVFEPEPEILEDKSVSDAGRQEARNKINWNAFHACPK